MRGKFSGKQGKVGEVDIKNTRIQVDGIQRTKVGGEKMITWFHPSKVKIIILDSEDARRLKGGKKTEKKTDGKTENKVEKPTVKKAAEKKTKEKKK
jgi:large subunit ribosomal protein L24